MTLAQAKKEFREAHPNFFVNGWDERDYMLWGDIRQLPSYGLIAGDMDNPMISRKAVIKLLEEAAEKRFEDQWRERFGSAHTEGSPPR